MSTLDPAALLQALQAANVQFVVIGDPESWGALRLVVSAHPTNLGALGRALEPFSPALDVAGVGGVAEPVGGAEPSEVLEQTEPTGVAGPTELARGAVPPGEGPRRIGDALGTVEVRTSAGTVVLLLGGAHRSLYAGTLAASASRELAGVRVRWAAEPTWNEEDAPGPTNALGDRLLSLASRLTQLMDRRGDRDDRDDRDGREATEDLA